jgi:hypothetical protein
MCFYDNLSVHVFIISNFSGQHRKQPLPPSPPPHKALQVVGEYWPFLSPTREFGCGFEAVVVKG